ncbi:MAG TPA: shikimate dehydrogenase, partial [Acidimicrobiales bacterium]
HSLSPSLHNAAFAALGIDWVYVALDVAPGSVPDAVAGVRALGIEGLSVTMPHKEAVADAVDELTPDARALHAVNCVARSGDSRLVGHNTDGDGLVDSLRADAGVDPAGSMVVVIGAGGAARSVVLALARAGAREVVVVGRTLHRAQAAAALAGSVGWVGGGHEIAGADIVVNATPVGMGDDAHMPFDPALLQGGKLVVDLVYHPLDTPLLRAARDRGARTLDGLGMLVHQAARQLTLWTGLDAPVDVMRAAAEAELAARRG